MPDQFDQQQQQERLDEQQQGFPEAQAPQPPVQGDPDYEKFANYMRSFLGADPEQLRYALQQNQANTLTLQQQRLQSSWGDAYEENFAAVQERLTEIAKTNPAQAQALNNADGALLLHQAIAYEKAQQSGVFQSGGLNRSSTPATPKAENFQFTASEIREMDPATRRANHSAIMAAYQQGLVDRNS